MSQLTDQGKRLVVRVAVIALVLALLPTITFNVTLGPVHVSTQIVRIALTLVLCFFLIRGRPWARATSVVVFGILGASSLAASMTVPGKSPSDLAFVASGVAYLYCAGLLIASSPVREFFAVHRGEPRERPAP